MDKVNLTQAFAAFDEAWSPRVAGEINGCQLKLVKLQGDFVWHHHEAEDELFLVVAGRLLMRFRDRDVWLDPGEFIIVPRGVDHLPCAPDGCDVVLLEPAATLNTGNVQNERTIRNLKSLWSAHPKVDVTPP